jgi:hypothetical protein
LGGRNFGFLSTVSGASPSYVMWVTRAIRSFPSCWEGISLTRWYHAITRWGSDLGEGTALRKVLGLSIVIFLVSASLWHLAGKNVSSARPRGRNGSSISEARNDGPGTSSHRPSTLLSTFGGEGEGHRTPRFTGSCTAAGSMPWGTLALGTGTAGRRRGPRGNKCCSWRRAARTLRAASERLELRQLFAPRGSSLPASCSLQSPAIQVWAFRGH